MTNLVCKKRNSLWKKCLFSFLFFYARFAVPFFRWKIFQDHLKLKKNFWKRTCLYFLGEYLMIACLLFNEKDHSRSNLDRCFSPRLNIWVDLCVGTQWDQRWLQDNWWVPVLANAVIEPNLTSLLKLEAGILQMRTTSQTLESERKIPNFLELLLKMPSSSPRLLSPNWILEMHIRLGFTQSQSFALHKIQIEFWG